MNLSFCDCGGITQGPTGMLPNWSSSCTRVQVMGVNVSATRASSFAMQSSVSLYASDCSQVEGFDSKIPQVDVGGSGESAGRHGGTMGVCSLVYGFRIPS